MLVKRPMTAKQIADRSEFFDTLDFEQRIDYKMIIFFIFFLILFVIFFLFCFSQGLSRSVTLSNKENS